MNGSRRRWPLVVIAALSFSSGVLLMAWISRHEPSPHPAPAAERPRPVGTSGPGHRAPATAAAAGDVDELRSRDLVVPIPGADVERWKGSFAEARNGHAHEAVDILAPRNTPIHAVDDGAIAKLFTSKAGGLTIYQLDPTRRFIYYYAHLERYADIHNGDEVARGEVIGYVGTSGDAPPDTPHLHFTIFRVADPARWWEGTPIDPYLVYTRSGGR